MLKTGPLAAAPFELAAAAGRARDVYDRDFATDRTGRRLQFDAQSESFVDDAEADQYLGRTYRQGFQLPDI